MHFGSGVLFLFDLYTCTPVSYETPNHGAKDGVSTALAHGSIHFLGDLLSFILWPTMMLVEALPVVQPALAAAITSQPTSCTIRESLAMHHIFHLAAVLTARGFAGRLQVQSSNLIYC